MSTHTHDFRAVLGIDGRTPISYRCDCVVAPSFRTPEAAERWVQRTARAVQLAAARAERELKMRVTDWTCPCGVTVKLSTGLHIWRRLGCCKLCNRARSRAGKAGKPIRPCRWCVPKE